MFGVFVFFLASLGLGLRVRLGGRGPVPSWGLLHAPLVKPHLTPETEWNSHRSTFPDLGVSALRQGGTSVATPLLRGAIRGSIWALAVNSLGLCLKASKAHAPRRIRADQRLGIWLP